MEPRTLEYLEAIAITLLAMFLAFWVMGVFGIPVH